MLKRIKIENEGTSFQADVKRHRLFLFQYKQTTIYKDIHHTIMLKEYGWLITWYSLANFFGVYWGFVRSLKCSNTFAMPARTAYPVNPKTWIPHQAKESRPHISSVLQTIWRERCCAVARLDVFRHAVGDPWIGQNWHCRPMSLIQINGCGNASGKSGYEHKRLPYARGGIISGSSLESQPLDIRDCQIVRLLWRLAIHWPNSRRNKTVHKRESRYIDLAITRSCVDRAGEPSHWWNHTDIVLHSLLCDLQIGTLDSQGAAPNRPERRIPGESCWPTARQRATIEPRHP